MPPNHVFQIICCGTVFYSYTKLTFSAYIIINRFNLWVHEEIKRINKLSWSHVVFLFQNIPQPMLVVLWIWLVKKEESLDLTVNVLTYWYTEEIQSSSYQTKCSKFSQRAYVICCFVISNSHHPWFLKWISCRKVSCFDNFASIDLHYHWMRWIVPKIRICFCSFNVCCTLFVFRSI